MQFAAVAAALVNGGRRVTPRYIAVEPVERDRSPQPHDGVSRQTHAGAAGAASIDPREQILQPATSAALRELFRLNVTAANGTGRRAEVAGLRLGGKTGTAELPGARGYQKRAVIASFVAALPMEAPRYLMLVSLFEPHPSDETRGQITAGVNAAPVTARIVQRIAPILGILPRHLEATE